MALEHDFFLVPSNVDIGYSMDTSYFIDKVVIHDDVIMYISDTLKWIPSKNPAKKGIPSGTGLNYYGVTLFDVESANTLRGVFSSWRDLFKNSPKVLKLTGSFSWTEGEESSGVYEKIILNRDRVIREFDKMIMFSDMLSEGKYYIYHLGI